jgi:DNA-binding response OmpR family regulator
LLILDIMMPKVTGYHILETLRKDPRTSFMPVIILSAKDSARDQKYGYKLGASIYLTKPFQPERLVKNVATMLGEVGFSHPRRKSLSMRDVNLRLQLHLSNLPTGATDLAAGEAHQQSGESGGFKLKRPLAQEQKKKEWLG